MLTLLCRAPLRVGEAELWTSATCLAPRGTLASIWVSSQGGLSFSELADPRWVARRPWGQRQAAPDQHPIAQGHKQQSLWNEFRVPVETLLKAAKSGHFPDPASHPLSTQDENIMRSMQLFENVI